MNIITTLLFLSYITLTISQPKVTVGRAKIIGTFMRTRKDRQVSAFLGIPYAEPPIGNLRFRNPIAKKPLEGTIMALKDGKMCIQFSNSPTDTGDEDCLFLNVYTPSVGTNKHKKLLPVMVYIHGGAYIYGSSNSRSFGPEYLLDKDIILVTMNYRLGILGFLSTGDSEAPGNFALKDQALALRWVQENIRNFGGNPQNVTLFGLSAGSNCVDFHVLSNYSNGLFHQYIMESGHANSYRSFQERESYSEFARATGKLFGCPSSNSRSLVNCLRNVDAKSLHHSISVFNETRRLFEMTWTPTNEPNIDGAFLTDTPFNLMTKLKRKDYPWIHGMTKDEGLYFLKSLYSDEMFKKIVKDLDGFLTKIFTTFPFVEDIPQVIKDVKNFYFHVNSMKDKSFPDEVGEPMPTKRRTYLTKKLVYRQLSKLFGDLFRYRYEFLLANHYSKAATKPLFLYTFDYRGTISMTAEIGSNMDVGVSHGDESLYIFPIGRAIYEKFNVTMSDEDTKMVDIMVDFWTSFAYNGLPTTAGVTNPNIWKPYNLGNNILNIGHNSKAKLRIVNTLFKKRMDFWSSRIRDSI